MKIDRDKVWKMFDCKCAYCGCELESSSGKHMHVDHVEPLRRNWWTNTSMFPDAHNEQNIFPSCPQCNNYKSSMDMETFRDWIIDTIRKLEKVTLYRNAIRFGFIKLHGWDGKFWYEKYEPKTK